MSQSEDAAQLQVLLLMKNAMKALKEAKSRGLDVKPARPMMTLCVRAFTAGDYAEAARVAEEVLRRYGPTT